MNQEPVDLDRIVADWTRRHWEFYESTKTVREGSGLHSSIALVRRATACQDHASAGTLALDVTQMARSLQMTWVRRLLDPAPQVWKNIVWEYIGESHGWMQQGARLLCSSACLGDGPPGRRLS